MNKAKSPKLYAALLALFLVSAIAWFFGPRNVDVHKTISAREYQSGNLQYSQPVKVEIIGTYSRRIFGQDEYRGVLKIDKYPETLANSVRADFNGRHAPLFYPADSGSSGGADDVCLGTLLCTPDFDQFVIIISAEKAAGGDGLSWSTQDGLFITSAQGGRDEALEIIGELSEGDGLFDKIKFH